MLAGLDTAPAARIEGDALTTPHPQPPPVRSPKAAGRGGFIGITD